MRRLIVLASVCALLLCAILVVTVLGLERSAANSQSTAANSQSTATLVRDVERLLLNGKTASAISARKTAREVGLLIQQQTYDHNQTEAQIRQQQHGTKIIAQVIVELEQHLDATIVRAVTQALNHP